MNFEQIDAIDLIAVATSLYALPRSHNGYSMSMMKLYVALVSFALTSIVARAEDVPRFAVDAAWPKPLDEKALTLDPPPSKCCRPAPPVMEFDGEGNLIRAWGGPGQGAADSE